MEEKVFLQQDAVLVSSSRIGSDLGPVARRTNQAHPRNRPASPDRRGLREGKRAPWPAFSHNFHTANENGTRRCRKSLICMVGDAGFEPATPAV